MPRAWMGILRDQGAYQFEYVRDQPGLVIKRPAAKAKAIETDLQESLSALSAKFRLASALDDCKNERAIFWLHFSGIKLFYVSLFGFLCPVDRAFDR